MIVASASPGRTGVPASGAVRAMMSSQPGYGVGGASKIKDAGKGVASIMTGEAGVLAQEATKEIAEAGATQFVANAKTVGQEMLKTGENLKRLAFKYTGVKAVETIVREGMNSGVQYLTSLSLDLVKPYICTAIVEEVKLMFSNPDLSHLLRKMYALDSIAR